MNVEQLNAFTKRKDDLYDEVLAYVQAEIKKACDEKGFEFHCNEDGEYWFDGDDEDLDIILQWYEENFESFPEWDYEN